MALTTIKTGGLADNSVTDAKVADAITVTGAQTGITQVGTLTAGTWNAGAVTSSGAVIATNFTATGGPPAFLMTETDTNPDSECRIVNGGGNLYIDGDLNDEIADSFMAFRLDNGSEKMRIDSAGTIFQGTTSPTLHSSVRGIVFENGALINDVTRGAGK